MKKLLAVLLVLLVVLSGCSAKSGKKDERPVQDIDNNAVNRVVNGNDLEGKDYIDLMKNYVVRQKNKENTTDNEEFNKFLDKIFIESMESDYLNMHYTVIDYKAYGIEKPELSVGEVEYTNDPDLSEYVAQMEELQSFDYDSLSYRQQYDYEVLEYSLLETLAGLCYQKYDQFFTGGSDILSAIITNFDEFVFYDREALDDYMVLLQDVDRYIEDCYKYTKAQADDGLYMIDYSIDYSIDYAKSYISKVDDNTLITSFNNRIEKVDFLTAEEKEAYKAQNEKIVKEEIIPVYARAEEELSQYYGKTTVDQNRMANINKEYAELVYMLNSSNNIGVDEIFNDAKERFDDYIALFNTALNSQANIDDFYKVYYGEIEPLGGSNEEILEFLANNYSRSYPDIGEIKYNISYLDASSASDSIVAYYMSSPLDDLNQNVIRVNPNNSGSDYLSSYTTIAHEGIPGHLYEHVHFYRTDPHNFRVTQGFSGYTEGYACYSQINALDYLPVNEGSKDIMFLQDFGGYIMMPIIDMGVNYYNWSEGDVAKFMEEAGYSGDYASEIMEDSIDRIGVLTRYGIGFLNFRKLHEYAEEKLGDKFDEISFNASVTDQGPMPFNILAEEVNEYIYGD